LHSEDLDVQAADRKLRASLDVQRGSELLTRPISRGRLIAYARLFWKLRACAGAYASGLRVRFLFLVGVRDTLFDRVNQIAGSAIKRPGQRKQHCERRLSPSQFQLAHIYTLDLSLKRQLLLGQVGLEPACAQFNPEGFRCFQICSLEMGALSVCRYNLSSY